MLSIEHSVDEKNISKMVHRYQQKNRTILAESITAPIMCRKKKQQDIQKLYLSKDVNIIEMNKDLYASSNNTIINNLSKRYAEYRKKIGHTQPEILKQTTRFISAI